MTEKEFQNLLTKSPEDRFEMIEALATLIISSAPDHLQTEETISNAFDEITMKLVSASNKRLIDEAKSVGLIEEV